MEFNLRPQWSMFNYHTYLPICGKCGLYKHKFNFCPASYRQCLKCGKFGHFARMCWSSSNQLEIRNTKSTKSEKKKTRDTIRIQNYHQTRNILRELPFSGLRRNALMSCLDVAAEVKAELKNTKQRLNQAKIQHKIEIAQLNKEVDSLKQKQRELCEVKPEIPESILNQLKDYKEKIRKFEDENEMTETFIKDIKEQYIRATKSEYELSLKVKQLSAENNQKEQTIIQQSKELNELHNQKVKFLEDIDDLIDEVNSLRDEIQFLENRRSGHFNNRNCQNNSNNRGRGFRRGCRR